MKTYISILPDKLPRTSLSHYSGKPGGVMHLQFEDIDISYHVDDWEELHKLAQLIHGVADRAKVEADKM